ncbi:uncharacterized protein CC84DRAFT_1173255 [Paraphaeosphaeria sporulosa]|uniref:Uncharacterized protein n=1 Tax=Paraphaeosphaeria sporulosa TaxID=1460663 RepID=A0A177CW35_9PLEO|nr:uncharacterized protein CC84DRAFT_1173255 [Paraphaeosphaeria sporulosa]OAG10939.1 hypothetical protein CC84DRAFT_1173255 [Paraphaeosphaeria sporulosa]
MPVTIWRPISILGYASFSSPSCMSAIKGNPTKAEPSARDTPTPHSVFLLSNASGDVYLIYRHQWSTSIHGSVALCGQPRPLTTGGPLTTTSTPSPICLSYPHVRSIDKGPVFYDGLGGDDGTCFKTGAARPDIYAYNYNTDCYPVSLSASADKEKFWQLSIGFFSPTNVCPSVWTTATTFVESGGETEIVCCPRWSNMSTYNGHDFDSIGAHYTDGTTLANYGLYHPPVILRWRIGDGSETTINIGSGTSPTAAPASSQSATPISTTTPGAGTRVAAGGIPTFVLGGPAIVAWLLA